MEKELAIKIENLTKQYRLGQIGGGTLSADLQSLWARARHKEDPNSIIGSETRKVGERFLALNGVNLEVYKGDTLGIVGANGAGKSTLLKILSRITAPTGGTVKIKGRISSMLEVGTGFNGEMTGRENIYMNGAILGMSRAEIDSKMEGIIEFSECAEFIDTPVKRYSSGMFVKLAFAVAAHLDSEILVMDEVLAVGDMKFQKKCLSKMGDVAQYEGRTVLYVSHNMNTIRQLCSRCVVMSEGDIIYDGDVESAIELYLEQGSDARDFYDLSKTPRPPYNQHGIDMFIDSIEFPDKTGGIFSCKKKMRFIMEWRSKIDAENMFLRAHLFYRDRSVAGTSESVSLGPIKAGESRSTLFEWQLPNVADGQYYFVIDLYNKNESGYHYSYDAPLIEFPLTLEPDHGGALIWNHSAYGHVRLPEIEAKDI